MADKKKLPPWLDKNKNGVVDAKEKGKGGKPAPKGKKKESMKEAMGKLPWQKGYHPKGK